MPKIIIFTILFIITTIIMSFPNVCMPKDQNFFDENTYFADSNDTKAKLEEIMKKTNLSNFKILIVKEGDAPTKPQIIQEVEKTSGYYFQGEIGKDLKIQMNLRSMFPFADETKLQNISSELSKNIQIKDILKKGYIPLEGEYFYMKYGEKIQLSGYLKENNELEITEYMLKETHEKTEKIILGNFTGKFNKDYTELSGEWKSADGNRNSVFSMKRVAIYKTTQRQYKVNRIWDDFNLNNIQETCKNEYKCLKDELKSNKYGYAEVSYKYIHFDDKKLANINKLLSDKKIEVLNSGDELAISTNTALFQPLYSMVDHDLYFYSSNLISIVTYSSEYSGGAHPNSIKNSIVFRLNKQTSQFEQAKLFDLLDRSDQCKKNLANLIFKALKSGEKKDDLFDDNHVKSAIKNAVIELTYLPNANGITFIFSPYEIGPYAAGFFEAKIRYTDLMKAGCIPKPSILMDLMDKKY